MLAIVVPLAHLTWLLGNITAYLTGTNSAPYQPTAALLHPAQVWPEAGETFLLIGARIVPALLLLTLGAAAGVIWIRHHNRGGGRKKKITGMAKARDIAPLIAKANTDKARSLRPSLKGAKHLDAKDTGVLLGNLQGTRHQAPGTRHQAPGTRCGWGSRMSPWRSWRRGSAKPPPSQSPPC